MAGRQQAIDLIDDDIEQTSDANDKPKSLLARRFRGFLPVVLDVETGGFNCATDAVLEVAALTVTMDDDGSWQRCKPDEARKIGRAQLQASPMAELAERVRALGHPAPGSISKMLDESVVTEEKDDTLEAAEMLKTLVNDHEAVARRFRETAELAEEQKDIVTADMLTARITFHEKAIWMLRAITAK